MRKLINLFIPELLPLSSFVALNALKDLYEAKGITNEINKNPQVI